MVPVIAIMDKVDMEDTSNLGMVTVVTVTVAIVMKQVLVGVACFMAVGVRVMDM